MIRFVATTFNFDTTIIDADSIEEAFDFMVNKFGIFSDPIVRPATIEDAWRFRGRIIPFVIIKPTCVTEFPVFSF